MSLTWYLAGGPNGFMADALAVTAARNEALPGVVAVSTAVRVAELLTPEDPGRDPGGVRAMSVADVIVIGAGFSGLKAAQELAAAGLTVVVLEGKDRVGGRVKHATLAGRDIDIGGQWIGTGHHLLRAEAKRFGIDTYAQYESGRTVMQMFAGWCSSPARCRACRSFLSSSSSACSGAGIAT